MPSRLSKAWLDTLALSTEERGRYSEPGWNRKRCVADRFARAIVEGGMSATEAYTVAGYAVQPNRARNASAAQLRLQGKTVKERLEFWQAQMNRRVDVTDQRITGELRFVAIADIADFICPETGRLLNPDELAEPAAAALKRFQRRETRGKQVITEVELHDRIGALRAVAYARGLITERGQQQHRRVRLHIAPGGADVEING